MTAGAYETWPRETLRERGAWPRMPVAAAISIALHVLILIAVLMAVAPEAWKLADRFQQSVPAVEVVPATSLQRVAAPDPDYAVETDRPSNALPPPVRKVVTEESELRARPDSPTSITGVAPVDLRALEEFVRNVERAERESPGQGWTWTTCSLLPPERRALEPACDGLLLRGRPVGGDGGVAVSLETPDGEVLAAIKRYQAGREAAPPPKKTSGEDDAQDRSYRNQTDDYYGPKPWE